MKLGIFAKTFQGTTPADFLQATRDAGYSCAQYNWSCAGLASMPTAIPDDALNDTKAAVASSGIELVALSGTFNMTHPNPIARSGGLTKLEAVIKSAAQLNISLVTLCTGSRDAEDQWRAHPDNDSASAWSDLVASMETAVMVAERYNVNLGIEPELANTVNSIDKAAKLIGQLGRRVKVVLDPANLFEVATDRERKSLVDDALDKLGPHLALAHAKDRMPDGSFTTAGKGVIDWQHYLGGLAATGYNGALITHGLTADEAPDVAAFLADRLP